jgi:N-acetylneuraminic acid mutarotase
VALATLGRISSCVRTFASLALGLALALAGCGGSSTPPTSTSSSTHARRAANRRPAPVRLAYRPLYSLPSPLRDPASAALGDGRFVLLGGLDTADTSTAGVEVADRRGITHTSSLPLAQHDAQGASLGGKVYVFGGGSASELDHIVSFDPVGGAVHAVGSLPHAQSDVAVTQSGGTAYVVGGYDGSSWLDTIIAWRPGSSPKVVAHLPVGLRYSSASAVGGQIVIIGGSTPSGASNAIYRFDVQTRRVRQIGRLPHPVTHAGAATLGSSVYLVGGRGDSLDAQMASVWRIDPLTGTVHPAGRIPRPLSDTGVLTVGNAIIVAGGLSQAGVVASVGELVAHGT